MVNWQSPPRRCHDHGYVCPVAERFYQSHRDRSPPNQQPPYSHVCSRLWKRVTVCHPPPSPPVSSTPSPHTIISSSHPGEPHANAASLRVGFHLCLEGPIGISGGNRDSLKVLCEHTLNQDSLSKDPAEKCTSRRLPIEDQPAHASHV